MEKILFFNSSIGKKVLMASTGLFLMIFLSVHLIINLFIFYGEKTFNSVVHFMSTNLIIQLLQYILAIGFILHIFLGIKLYIKNKLARGNINYTINKWKYNTPFNARSMIYTGILIFLFIFLHLINFFLPIKIENNVNHYKLVTSLFKIPIYTIIYIISFIILAIHISHGFKSSFQSIGIYNKRYLILIKKLGIFYFWSISLGFSIIAIWFYFF